MNRVRKILRGWIGDRVARVYGGTDAELVRHASTAHLVEIGDSSGHKGCVGCSRSVAARHRIDDLGVGGEVALELRRGGDAAGADDTLGKAVALVRDEEERFILEAGPPMVVPNWFWLNFGRETLFRLLKKLLALKMVLRKYS